MMPHPTITSARPECSPSVIAAAKQLMAEVGYGGMSMRQVAGRAGLSAGSLYYYVADKHDLLLMVVQDAIEHRELEWKRHRRAKTTLARLKELVTFLIAWQASHPADVTALRSEARYLEPKVRSVIMARSERPLRYLEKLIVDGKREGLFTNVDGEHRTALTIMALVEAAKSLDEAQHQVPVATHVLRCALRLLGVRSLAA
jgi:AcrR family transcriptional regulator